MQVQNDCNVGSGTTFVKQQNGMQALSHAMAFDLLRASPEIVSLGSRYGKEFCTHGRLTNSWLIIQSSSYTKLSWQSASRDKPFSIEYKMVRV